MKNSMNCFRCLSAVVLGVSLFFLQGCGGDSQNRTEYHLPTDTTYVMTLGPADSTNAANISPDTIFSIYVRFESDLTATLLVDGAQASAIYGYIGNEEEGFDLDISWTPSLREGTKMVSVRNARFPDKSSRFGTFSSWSVSVTDLATSKDVVYQGTKGSIERTNNMVF